MSPLPTLALPPSLLNLLYLHAPSPLPSPGYSSLTFPRHRMVWIQWLDLTIQRSWAHRFAWRNLRQWRDLVKEEAREGGNCKMEGPTDNDKGSSPRRKRQARNSLWGRVSPSIIPWVGKTQPIPKYLTSSPQHSPYRANVIHMERIQLNYIPIE
jgi:hypothetical protein